MHLIISRLRQVLGGALAGVSALFLAFVFGAGVMYTDAGPASWLEDAFRAARAQIRAHWVAGHPLQTSHWKPVRAGPRGLTVDRGAVTGTTLITDAEAGALLLGPDGEVRHRWDPGYSRVWAPGGAVDQPEADPMILIRRADALPDGRLLALFEAAGDTPYGYGMAMLAPDGSVIWRYMAHAHHDFDRHEDRRIAVATQRLGPAEPVGGLKRPVLRDQVDILGPDGRRHKRIDVLSAWLASPFGKPGLNSITRLYGTDPLHLNSVAWVGSQLAERLDAVSPGDLLISFRELSAIAVLDPDSETIVWATTGDWLAQHDPRVLPGGDLMVYDNHGHYRPGNRSRIIRVDPETGATTPIYTGTPEQPFQSAIRGSARRLPGGSTLITESNGARVFQIDTRSRIVWDYTRPTTREGQAPVVCDAQRYDRGYFKPGFTRDLEAR